MKKEKEFKEIDESELEAEGLGSFKEKEFKCSLCGKPREDENKSFCDACDEKELENMENDKRI